MDIHEKKPQRLLGVDLLGGYLLYIIFIIFFTFFTMSISYGGTTANACIATSNANINTSTVSSCNDDDIYRPLLGDKGKDNVNTRSRKPSFIRRTFSSLQHKLAGDVGQGCFVFTGRIEKEQEQQNFEALNYDFHESAISMAEVRKCKSNRQSLANSLLANVITIAIGFCTAVIGLCINLGVKNLSEFKFNLISESIISYNNKGYLALTTASFLVLFAPVAAGSGIPEIKCYLNGIKVPCVVRFKTLLVKSVGVLFSVSSGLAVGKEGPMIHSGSVVAAGLSQFKSTSFPWINFHFGKIFRNDRSKRDFVAAGAAAGVAVAFGAPIGGVLFSLEEGASFWSPKVTWRTFLCAMTGTFVLNFFLSGALDAWGDLSNPGLVNFGNFYNEGRSLWQVQDLLIFAAIGVCGGLAGAALNWANEHLTCYRMKNIHKRHKIVRVAEVVFVNAATTLVLFMLVMLMGECRAKSKINAIETTRDFFCPEGYYNDMATIAFNPIEDAIHQLFHNRGEFSILTLIVFFFVYALLTCWTYGLSVPSGVFLPSLLTGAAFGRLVGEAVKMSSFTAKTYSGTYALIGAAAFLSGVVRMTISLTVILIESTNNASYGLPLMVTVLIAKWVGDRFNTSLYDIHIELQKVPWLDWEPPKKMEDFYAAHVMNEPVISLKPISRVGDVVRVLHDTRHCGFPVVDKSMCVHPHYAAQASRSDGRELMEGVLKMGRGLFLGLVLRKDLTVILKEKAFGLMDESKQNVIATQLQMSNFTDVYPRHPLIESMSFTVEEENMFIDLTLYMNPCPFTVQQIAPLPRVFALFRSMGLRHLPVLDRYNQIVGMITRMDLCYLEYHFHRKFEFTPSFDDVPGDPRGYLRRSITINDINDGSARPSTFNTRSRSVIIRGSSDNLMNQPPISKPMERLHSPMVKQVAISDRKDESWNSERNMPSDDSELMVPIVDFSESTDCEESDVSYVLVLDNDFDNVS